MPAKGESLTEKVISSVGSEIFTKGSDSTAVGSQIVSPIVIFSTPEIQTISPAVASSTFTLFKPSMVNRFATFALYGSC